MKTLGLSFLALGLLLAAAPLATAQDNCQTSFTLVGKEDNKWYLAGSGAANPRLTACPGQEITFTIQVEGANPHNFLVQASGAPPVTETLNDGQETTYAWTAPASGNFQYICQIHGTIMAGTVDAAQQSTGGNGGGDGGNDTPGFEAATLALAGVAAVLLLRRK